MGHEVVDHAFEGGDVLDDARVGSGIYKDPNLLPPLLFLSSSRMFSSRMLSKVQSGFSMIVSICDPNPPKIRWKLNESKAYLRNIMTLI